MDRLQTSGEVARLLGTSVPRVLRAARQGVVPSNMRGNRILFDAHAVERLRRRWGSAPRIEGLGREDVLALAALGRRPLGLRSARALARATGLSPTAAGRALQRLAGAGYVERKTARVVEGRVREVPVWMVRWGSPEWLAVAATVSTALLPQRPRTGPPPRRVPARLAHVFWNEDLSQLDVERDAVLIAGRILQAEDPEAMAWMSRVLPPAAIGRASRSRGLDPRRARLGRLLAAARLRGELDRRGGLHVTTFDPAPGRQTLNGYLGAMKLQVLEASSLVMIEPTAQVEGLRVAGIGNLLAMKLKVIRERGELRDYFDVLVIERDANRLVEEGVALALRKYRPEGQDEFVDSLVRALGYLDDVEEDPAVPMSKAAIGRYWAARVPEISANLSRLG